MDIQTKGDVNAMKLRRGDVSDVYLPEGVFPAYVEEAYVEKGVRTPFGIVDQLTILYGTEHLNRLKKVREKYIIPYTKMNKAGRAIEALMGYLPDNLELVDLFDKDCHIRIEHRALKRGGVWTGVSEVFPFEDRSTPDMDENIPESQPPDPEFDDPDRHLSYWEAPEGIPPDPDDIRDWPSDPYENIDYEPHEYMLPNPDDIYDMEPDFFDDGSHDFVFEDDVEPHLDEEHGRYWPPVDYN